MSECLCVERRSYIALSTSFDATQFCISHTRGKLVYAREEVIISHRDAAATLAAH